MYADVVVVVVVWISFKSNVIEYVPFLLYFEFIPTKSAREMIENTSHRILSHEDNDPEKQLIT